MNNYNYKVLIEKIESDIKAGVIITEDNLYIIRSTEATDEDYRPIVDYKYEDTKTATCKKMRVSWILKEMRDLNSDM